MKKTNFRLGVYALVTCNSDVILRPRDRTRASGSTVVPLHQALALDLTPFARLAVARALAGDY